MNLNRSANRIRSSEVMPEIRSIKSGASCRFMVSGPEVDNAIGLGTRMLCAFDASGNNPKCDLRTPKVRTSAYLKDTR